MCRNEWKKGITVLERFTQQHPNCPRGWYHYAQWLYRTGAPEAAAEAIAKAYALYPNDKEIRQAVCEISPSARRRENLASVHEQTSTATASVGDPHEASENKVNGTTTAGMGTALPPP